MDFKIELNQASKIFIGLSVSSLALIIQTGLMIKKMLDAFIALKKLN